MVIELKQIPEHLQKQFLEKVTYVEFRRFRRTCHSALKVCESVTKRLPVIASTWEVGRDNDVITVGTKRHPFTPLILLEPVRFTAEKLIIQTTLTDDVCRRTISRFEGTNSTVSSVELQQNIQMPTCDPALFHQLIEVTNTKGFHQNVVAMPFMPPIRMAPDYFRHPAFQKLEAVNICSTFLDGDLVMLNARTLRVYDTNLHAGEFNKLLKQWFAGTREVVAFDAVTLTFNQDDDTYEAILKDIPNECIWDEGMHYSTAVAYRDLEDIINFDIMKIYGVDNGGKKLCVVLTDAENNICNVILAPVADFDAGLRMIIGGKGR